MLRERKSRAEGPSNNTSGLDVKVWSRALHLQERRQPLVSH